MDNSPEISNGEEEWTFVDASELTQPKKETKLIEPFEVIANPPLPNLALIYSTPVRREWQEGNLLRHVRAVLSQNLPKDVTIESNYILNKGHFSDFYQEEENKKKAEVEEDLSQSLSFLKKIVQVQSLTNQPPNSEAAKQVQQIIDNEADPLVKDVLHMAREKAAQVAFSLVNIEDEEQLYGMGYTLGTYIAGVRSVGMDYAYKRLNNNDAVFIMNDADTVPATNSYAADLLKLYKQHPQVKYIFSGVSYLPAGEEKDMVANSLFESSSRTIGYNSYPNSSVQISFKKEVMETLQGIVVIDQVHEDYQTVKRLRNFFGAMQNGVLMNEGVFLPTHLTAERSTGFVDGSGRGSIKEESGIQLFEESFPKAKKLMNELLYGDNVDEEIKAKAQVELELVREKYHRQQETLLRFNKRVVIAFLNNLDLGNISISDGDIKINEAEILQGGRNPFARPLLTFIRANNELVATLTPEDIALIKYYVLNKEFPSQITVLNPFQRALREYLGEYPKDLSGSIDELEKMAIERGITDKTTVYQPFIAEMLARGNVVFRYNSEEANDREIYEGELGMPLAQRSAWLDQSLPGESEIVIQKMAKESGFFKRIASILPFGSLAKYISTRT